MANGLVEPIGPAATPPEVTPISPETASLPDGKQPESSEQLPDDLLQLPAFQALFAGQPPALSAAIKDFQKRPETKLVIDNKEPLMRAGIGFYRSLSGDLGVVFNQFYIHPNEIQEADKAGKLQEIAPPFDAVTEAVSKAGADNPVLKHSGQVPPGPKSAPMPTMPPPSPPAPPPASAQTKTSSARVKNLQPSAPTSGPKPGAGRLLNSILKPVI